MLEYQRRGFERGYFSDHVLAAFLRKHDALDSSQIVGNSTTWSTPDGEPLVIACYSGDDGMTVTYWVRQGLLP